MEEPTKEIADENSSYSKRSGKRKYYTGQLHMLAKDKYGGNKGKQKVYQFEAAYPYACINEYPSTVEAAEAISMGVSDVYDCCMSKKDLAGGYDWMLESVTYKKEPIEQYGMRL